MSTTARHSGLHALRNDQDLVRYVIEGIATGRQLGTGSYGSVEEVEINGLLCAGKKIHEVLLDAENVGVRDITKRYAQECHLMYDLRHPNIIQFLGVCFLPNCRLPVLVMERLEGNLNDLLETVPSIPLVLKRSILEDIARGLLYLHKHNPQIIHRDLTAKNVLLTASFVAKITDFGNSRIVNLQPGQLAQIVSRLPGTLVYMPPEAQAAASRYGPSIDVFSFGHLALFTLNQVFPGDLLEHTFPDPNNPNRLIGRSEIERRGKHFEQLEQSLHRQHPSLIQLTKDCLHNTPSQRPTAEQLVVALEGMKANIEGPYGEFSKLDAVRQVATMKAIERRELEMKEKTDELAVKDDVILTLQKQLKHAQIQIQQQDMELQKRNSELQRRKVEVTHLQEQLETAQATGRQFKAQLSALSQPRIRTQSQFSEMKVPLKLRWRQGRSMPSGMSNYPQAVVLNGKVCIGGGNPTDQKFESAHVMVYDLESEMWTTLPPYSHIFFGMAVVNNQLLLIGGQDPTVDKTCTTGQLGVWSEESKQWRHSAGLPPMPTPRSSMAVAYGNKWLLVAGGLNDEHRCLSKVEILSIDAGKWFHSAPLPQPAEKMTTAIVGDTVVLLGGACDDRYHKKVFIARLDYNLGSSNVKDEASQCIWQTLPDTPFMFSTALALNGALLAVGGEDKGSSDIHLFQPSSNCWVKAGHLPSGRVRCACTVLPSGRVFVAGGATPTPRSENNPRIPDIASVIV